MSEAARGEGVNTPENMMPLAWAGRNPGCAPARVRIVSTSWVRTAWDVPDAAMGIPPAPLDAASGATVAGYFLSWAFGCQSASVAPVGSVMTLMIPYSPTSITSWTTLAPSSRAFLVDARTSSTPT